MQVTKSENKVYQLSGLSGPSGPSHKVYPDLVIRI